MSGKKIPDSQKDSFTTAEVKALVEAIQRIEPTFELLDRESAAAYVRALKIKKFNSQSLANLASEGRGPVFLPFGRDAYYLQKDLDEWILKHRVDPREPRCRKLL